MRSEKRKATSGPRKGKKAKFDVIDTVFDGPSGSSTEAGSSQPITVRHVDFSESSSGRRRQKTKCMQVIPDPREQAPAYAGDASSDNTVNSILAVLPVAEAEDLEGLTGDTSPTTQAKRPRSDLRAVVSDRSSTFSHPSTEVFFTRIVFGSGSLPGKTSSMNCSPLKAARSLLKRVPFSAIYAESALQLYDVATASDVLSAASHAYLRSMPRTCCTGSK